MADITTPEVPSAPVVETTQDNSNVAKPISTAKPYDDELLDAYSEQSKQEEATSAEEPKKEEPVKEEVTEEAIKPGERKGDKVDDGLEDLPIKRVINGKEVEFKIKDAIQAYTQQAEFNRNIDKRVAAVGQKEHKWNQDQAQFKEKVGKLIEHAQGGDFVTAIRALAKIATSGTGLDVVEFEKKYFDQLERVRDVYTNKSPEERRAFFAERALADAREKAKGLEEEKTAHAEKSQLQEKVSTLQKQYEVEDPVFWKNYKALESSQVGEGKAFKNREDIKPEDVIRFTLAVRHEEKVIAASEKFGIEDESILDEISRITASDPSLTVEDISKVIEASGIAKNANPKAVENLNRKVQKSGNQFNQVSSAKKENGKVEGWDKEDLDFLYRNQPKVYSRPTR
jgi:hypothetical protein